ncbi:MAG: LysM peptidoglycan-binding domain-containing protein [Myxococcales bacterium]|nr:LysM peptidoglycan-binding domain-containing protein [Polyangiaceae bacterium]MDW8249758.1 LysM peptidoglycan-binding domain-containing protein [Myxococcales bacterium]
MPRFFRWFPWLSLVVLALLPSSPADAFPHVLQRNESLARIAERVYGRVDYEKILVAANGLDAGGGIPAIPGQRLEIPALQHVRVQAGDTWASLAEALLGHAERQDVLSAANGSSPWMTPAEGAEIVVPYNLRVIAGPSDSIVSIALRFLGSREKAWVLDRYNFLKGRSLKRGDVVLVPLTSLALTEAGRAEAAAATFVERSQAAGGTREAQRRAEAEMPSLLAEVRGGRYLDAVQRGTRMLAYGDLARPQLATIHRQLLEAYAALDARGHAASSCRTWLESDPAATLDPIQLSPKLLAACQSAASSPSPSPSSAPSVRPR